MTFGGAEIELPSLQACGRMEGLTRPDLIEMEPPVSLALTVSVPGCVSNISIHGGGFTMPGVRGTAEERFWRHVVKTADGCWNWNTVPKGKKRYPNFNYYGHRSIPANRAAWLIQRGPIPPGMWVLHTCDNKRCVRADEVNSHLYLGTVTDNNRDALDRGRVSRGDRHGAAMRGRSPSGDAHWSRRRPEMVKRGPTHYTVARPEAIRRGTAHPLWGRPNPARQGERVNFAKITAAIVRSIRQAHADGMRQIDIAHMAGLSPASICLIVNRKRWRHIE